MILLLSPPFRAVPVPARVRAFRLLALTPPFEIPSSVLPEGGHGAFSLLLLSPPFEPIPLPETAAANSAILQCLSEQESAMLVQQGSTDQSVEVRFISVETGMPVGTVNASTSGLALWYRRESAAAVAITPVNLAAANSAHSDGGIKHVADGVYRLDLPDAACAAGVKALSIGGSADGLIVIPARVQLVPWNPQNAASLGLTNIDATISSRLSDKEGFKLAADGLDLITLSVPSAPHDPATLPQMIVGLHRYAFNRLVYTGAGWQLYNDADDMIVTAWPTSISAGVQTRGQAGNP